MKILQKDTIENYLGLPCEVMTNQNEPLFVGIMRDYDSHLNEVHVEARQGEVTPGGIIYHTPVKIQIRSVKRFEDIVLLYGFVIRCAPQFLRVELNDTSIANERREHFRQRTDNNATVQRLPLHALEKPEPDEPRPCRMVDISLNGLCFQSKDVYYIGDVMRLQTTVRKNGPEFTFKCVVRRKYPCNEKKTCFRYGCSFVDMRMVEQNKLCYEICKLQAQTLNYHRFEE